LLAWLPRHDAEGHFRVHYRRRLEALRAPVRPALLDFLAGLRAELFGTAFLAGALRGDFLATAGAAFTTRFGLTRDLAAAALGFLTAFAGLAKEATAWLTAVPAASVTSFALSIADLATSRPVCGVSTIVFCTVERMLSWLLSS
jgi:hypothetical protein